ncbi:hypothetical protein LJC49_01455 [Ruminococcaceae bacterium OttesenSCG-928-I18]|nr:hypothetical protein [Ruminococcaceae bacterium OttesenSCG-928-I18]
MPNIVSARGVHLTEDVVKIEDIFPSRVKVEQKLFVEENDGDDTRVVIMDVFDLNEEESLPENASDLEADALGPMRGELLQNALQEAEQIKARAAEEAQAERDALMADAMTEIDQLKQEAIAQGHQEGYDTVVATVQRTADELESSLSRMEGELAGFEAEYEQQLQWMALEIASKVLAKKVSEDDAVLKDMVGHMIDGMKNESWIRVEVAQDMTRLIGTLQDLYDGSEQVDISAIPADSGTILIETASGVIDASLKTQLENLKIYFQKSVE